MGSGGGKKPVSLRNALDEAVNVNFTPLLIHFYDILWAAEGGTQKALGLSIGARWGVGKEPMGEGVELGAAATALNSIFIWKSHLYSNCVNAGIQ